MRFFKSSDDHYESDMSHPLDGEDEICEKAEKTLFGWFSDEGDSGIGILLTNPNPFHQSNNFPLFLDQMLPSD